MLLDQTEEQDWEWLHDPTYQNNQRKQKQQKSITKIEKITTTKISCSSLYTKQNSV